MSQREAQRALAAVAGQTPHLLERRQPTLWTGRSWRVRIGSTESFRPLMHFQSAYKKLPALPLCTAHDLSAAGTPAWWVRLARSLRPGSHPSSTGKSSQNSKIFHKPKKAVGMKIETRIKAGPFKYG
jgi:hypothetical protein